MGKFVEWSDTLSVGIEEIDERHKMLVDLVNKMHEAIHQGHGGDVVKASWVTWQNIPRFILRSKKA